MKVYKTSKLFFNKYPYKIQTNIKGANLIRVYSIDRLKEFCLVDSDESKTRVFGRRLIRLEKLELLEYVRSVEKFLENKIHTRIEHDTINFYLNDETSYKEVLQKVKRWTSSITEPDNQNDIHKLNEKSGLSIVNQLPYDKFHYKIFIRYTYPHVSRLDFLNWLKNYEDKISISTGTKKWLEGTTQYFYDPFMYVEDRNTMLMSCLYLGKYARKIHEFVLRDEEKTDLF